MSKFYVIIIFLAVYVFVLVWWSLRVNAKHSERNPVNNTTSVVPPINTTPLNRIEAPLSNSSSVNQTEVPPINTIPLNRVEAPPSNSSSMNQTEVPHINNVSVNHAGVTPSSNNDSTNRDVVRSSNHNVSAVAASDPDKFGPVNYYANARHGQQDKWFQFEYKKSGDEWLSYILRMPDLNGRSGNLHITHRYCNNGRYWVCYDPQPKTLRDAQIISKAWADRELEYIATGVAFEQQHW